MIVFLDFEKMKNIFLLNFGKYFLEIFLLLGSTFQNTKIEIVFWKVLSETCVFQNYILG